MRSWFGMGRAMCRASSKLLRFVEAHQTGTPLTQHHLPVLQVSRWGRAVLADESDMYSVLFDGGRV